MKAIQVISVGLCLAAGYIARAEEINDSQVAMYIWSDKYVYQAGETITLRYTLKPNGDTYPYSMVLLRQNNQTGAKVYLPKNSEEISDFFGNPAENFKAAPVEAAEKKILVENLPVPNELGMHTFILQLRDSEGNRVLKAAYMKIGVVEGFEDITGNITSDRTLVNTKAYRLGGVVFVKNNATLTIEPGTFVFGQPGSQPPSVLVVTRNGKIMASGTKSRPIVMTSSLPFGERQRGDWGGLILLGRAPINVGANTSQNNRAGEFFIEGLPASEDTVFGGTDPDHDCGTLRYVRVEYAGSIFAPNNEANSFTWGGCGKKTKAEYLQAIYGLDDSFEWFGGTMDAKYLIGGLGADDYVDFQLGYTGRVQFGIFYYNADSRGNRGIEGDNSEYNQSATPLSKPIMYNLTFIGGGVPGFDEANSPGIYLRRGSGGEFNNIVVTNFYSPGLDIADAATQAQLDNGNLKINGLLLWNNGLGTNAPNTISGQVSSNAATQGCAQGTRGQCKMFVVRDPNMKRPFEWSDPDFRGYFSSPIFRTGWVQPPDDGFFDQTAYFIGGVGEKVWWEEWTSFLQDVDIKK
jgi:hypothetical protein